MKSYALLCLSVILCSPVLAQEHATEIIQSSLIDAPDTVEPGKLIAIRMPPHLPFKIVPEPQNKLSFIDEESGLRAYLILEAKAPGYTIKIDYAVVHPTDEEIKSAPWDDREKFAKWLAEKRTDEVYRDERFVKVGEGPDPGPDPPGPGPSPVEGPVWIIILEESSERSPATATILGDKAFIDRQQAAGNKFRVYDDDSPDAAAFSALTTIRPALIVQSAKNGKVLKTMALPKDSAGIEAVLKEVQK